MSEGGIGWIPYFLDRIDYVYEHHQAWTGQDFGDKLPSQLFRERVITCFIDDPAGVKMRHDIGIDTITWECDYPHSDCTWPTSPERLMKSLDGVPDDDINKMTHLNAIRDFHFDPFAHRPQGAVHGGRAAGRGDRRRHRLCTTCASATARRASAPRTCATSRTRTPADAHPPSASGVGVASTRGWNPGPRVSGGRGPGSEGEVRNMQSRLERWAPLTGIGFVVLWIVGFFVAVTDSPDFAAKPAENLKYYVDDKSSIIAGVIVSLIGLLFLLWFVGSIRPRSLKAEGGDGRVSAIGFAGGDHRRRAAARGHGRCS